MSEAKSVFAALLLCLAFLTVALVSMPASGAAVQTRHSAAAEQVMTGGDAGEARVARELLPGEKLNINTAGAEELKKLPGIGDKLSAAIVAYREEYGDFAATEELLEVEGIGRERFEAIRERITVEDVT